MGVKDYTIVQSSFRQDTLTFRKIPFTLWKRKTKGFNGLQKAFITSLVSIFAFGFVSLVYFFITEGL